MSEQSPAADHLMFIHQLINGCMIYISHAHKQISVRIDKLPETTKKLPEGKYEPRVIPTCVMTTKTLAISSETPTTGQEQLPVRAINLFVSAATRAGRWRVAGRRPSGCCLIIVYTTRTKRPSVLTYMEGL